MDNEEKLRARGLRSTRPRLAVLDILAHGGHLDVEEIARRAKVRLGAVSTQGVYDVLGALTRCGLARRVEPAGLPAHYEAYSGDDHHHTVCRACGAINDIACTGDHFPCVSSSTSQGFVVENAEVTFWGLCGMCQVSADK